MSRLRELRQFLAALLRAQHQDQLLLRAASLAYTTLLSVVPILTVLLVTTASVEPERAALVVRGIAAVLPFSPEQVQDTLAAFAARTVAAGWIAVLVSFLVTVNAFYQVEEVINAVWAVPRRRSWRLRLASFLALLVWGPLSIIVLFSSLYWMSSRPWYPSIAAFGRPLPMLIAMVTLTALYRWVPNTRVPWRAAIAGAAVASLALFGLHIGFQTYLGLVAGLNVIYGSLTLVLLFLVSLLLFWLAVLLGAEASWVVARPPHPARASVDAVLELLGRTACGGGMRWKQAEEVLGSGWPAVAARLLESPPVIERDEDGFRLARDPGAITLGELYWRLSGLEGEPAAAHAETIASRLAPAPAAVAAEPPVPPDSPQTDRDRPLGPPASP